MSRPFSSVTVTINGSARPIHLRRVLSRKYAAADNLGSAEALAGATRAVVIGGGAMDVEAARATRDAGVRVFPIATTCAGADRVCTEAVRDRAWGLSANELMVLMFEDTYDNLFRWLLSL